MSVLLELYSQLDSKVDELERQIEDCSGIDPPIHREYFKAYNRLKGRKNRGGISADKWNQQVAMIQDWRDAAVRGEMSGAELKQKLDGAWVQSFSL